MRARSLEVGEAGCVSLALLTLGLGSQWSRFSASSPGTSKPSCVRASSRVSDPLLALLHAVLLRGLPPPSQDVPAQECSQTVNENAGASLVAQWLGVCLLMRGTRVRALVWEDPACRGAAGPVSHNC